MARSFKEYNSLLSKPTGRWTTGAGLYNAACRFFGTWDKALITAGIFVDDIKEKPFWTKRKIILAIQALQKANVPLNSAHLQFDRNRETTDIIRVCLGKPRTGNSLIGAAYRIFGSWDNALEEAGLNPFHYRKKLSHWDKQSISRIVKALYESNVPLNGGDLSKNASDETTLIIEKKVGRKLQGRCLYRIGCKEMGSWDEVLKYSGLKPGLIRKNGSRCDRNGKKLIEYIQSLYLNNYELNSSSIIKNSKKIKDFIELKFGQVVSGHSIKTTSKSLFGSWNSAIWEAGLNPIEISKRSPNNTSSLPYASLQHEVIKVGGVKKGFKFFGNAPKSADILIEEKVAVKALETAVDKMKMSDQVLIERIFNAILQIHHYRDQKQLILYVTRWLGGDVSKTQVASVFKKLKNDIGSDYIF